MFAQIALNYKQDPFGVKTWHRVQRPQGEDMAKRTTTTLVDDIDGSEATQTVSFGLDGTTYEIDLNDVHAEDLREVLAPFVSVARPVAGASRQRVNRSTTKTKSDGTIDTKAVRAWAEANGVEVSGRGRIKADVLRQYEAAQQ